MARRRGFRRRGSFVTLRVPRWLFTAIARLFGRARKRVQRARFSRRRFASHRRFGLRSRRSRGYISRGARHSRFRPRAVPWDRSVSGGGNGGFEDVMGNFVSWGSG